MRTGDKATVEIELGAKNWCGNSYMVRIGEYVFYAPESFVYNMDWKTPWHPVVGQPAVYEGMDVDVMFIDGDEVFIRYQDCGEADLVLREELEAPDGE